VSETIILLLVCRLTRNSSTAETFVDGWVRTGDEVIIRDDEMFVVDRVKVPGVSRFYLP
jgi:acyl-CoA synthetase (AMP-forming)/AMP-acid ligase II